MSGTLRIHDLEFSVSSAELEICREADSFLWNVNVLTSARDVAGGEWEPRFYGEMVRVPGFTPGKLVGEEFYVRDAYDEESEEYNFAMYVFEHGDAFDCRIRPLEMRDDQIRIEWTGKCNVNWDEPYGEDVSFALDAWFKLVES